MARFLGCSPSWDWRWRCECGQHTEHRQNLPLGSLSARLTSVQGYPGAVADFFSSVVAHSGRNSRTWVLTLS